MKSLLHVIFAMSLVFVLASCKSDDDEPVLLNAGETISINSANIGDLDDATLYVCESADEVRSLLGKDAPGNVDFNKNVIILVKDTANYGVADINATSTHSAAGYDINVAVALNFTTVMEPWCIGVVMPRTGDMTTNLTIEYVQ